MIVKVFKQHMSRERAQRYRNDYPYAVISITDPDSPDAEFLPDKNRLAILRLKFHDFIQEPEEFERLLREAEPPADLEEPRVWVLPTLDHAREIVDFYREWAPRIERLIIHCEAGISRSAGVGVGLARCLGEPDVHFYHQSAPNLRVARLIVQAWSA